MRKLVFTIVLTMLTAMAAHADDKVGVYMVTPTDTVKIKPLRYSGTEVEGGLFKSRADLVFRGAHSEHRGTGEITLLVKFGIPEPCEASTHWMFTPGYSIEDFIISRFRVREGTRRLTTVKSSISDVSSGLTEIDSVEYDVKEIAEGVYEVHVTGSYGEYCIVSTASGTGGYSGVFDFALDRKHSDE